MFKLSNGSDYSSNLDHMVTDANRLTFHRLSLASCVYVVRFFCLDFVCSTSNQIIFFFQLPPVAKPWRGIIRKTRITKSKRSNPFTAMILKVSAVGEKFTIVFIDLTSIGDGTSLHSVLYFPVLSTNPRQFQIKICTEEFNREDEDNGLACQLVFTYTEKYPDTAPLVEIEDKCGFEDDYEEKLLHHIQETVSERILFKCSLES